MKTKQEIMEFLECELPNHELINIWNEYCSDNSYDDTIYYMHEFDNMFANLEPSEIAKMVFNGDFCVNCDYFQYSVYLTSTDYPEEMVDFDALADYIIANDTSFYNDDLREFLDSEEEEEDD